ncbi:MAG: hypothetical protein EUB_01575 [Eubacterium sp.]|uniref:hypothetical protein n=1 Tax=Eubacterium sp. TaxID=142586 RepID=UPI0030625ADB
MALSRLSKQCRDCLFVDHCDHKEMEALAVMDTTMLVKTNTSESVINNPICISVNEIDQLIYKDEIKKAIKKELCKNIFLK